MHRTKLKEMYSNFPLLLTFKDKFMEFLIKVFGENTGLLLLSLRNEFIKRRKLYYLADISGGF